MKKMVMISLLYLQSIFGVEPLNEYSSILQKLNKPNGDYHRGEIEVVVDPLEISKIQKIQENRLLKKGFSAEEAFEFSRIGVIAEDQYWTWLRDAVYFPKGVPGTYNRVVWKRELIGTSHGVALLPLLPSGQVVLILNYRHATRSWELEIPRGLAGDHETIEVAALRELKNETGLIASSLTFLGKISPDSGVLSSVIPIFLATISSQQESNQDYSEAIAGTLFFTKEELKKGLIEGFLEVMIEGKQERVPLRDSFLTFALLQAEYRKLL